MSCYHEGYGASYQMAVNNLSQRTAGKVSVSAGINYMPDKM